MANGMLFFVLLFLLKTGVTFHSNHFQRRQFERNVNIYSGKYKNNNKCSVKMLAGVF